MADPCFSRDLFIWRKEHERCLVTELLSVEPYILKPSSKDRGNAWKTVADDLNQLDNPSFRVSARAVRDKFNKMVDMHKKNEREEARASGIEGRDDEVYQGMTEIVQRMEEATAQWKDDKVDEHKRKRDKEQAEETRKKATERIGETMRRREAEDGDAPPARKKRAIGENVYHLVEEGVRVRREARENDIRLREMELEERKLHRETMQQLVLSHQAFMRQMQHEQQQFMLQLQQKNFDMMQQFLEIMRTMMGTQK